MHFEERNEGDYRIYAGALEASGGGYLAAVVVSRLRGMPQAPCEAYRDISMSGGHRWQSPNDALAFAVTEAQKIIRGQPQRLAC
jgi:hypothetical protein